MRVIPLLLSLCFFAPAFAVEPAKDAVTERDRLLNTPSDNLSPGRAEPVSSGARVPVIDAATGKNVTPRAHPMVLRKEGTYIADRNAQLRGADDGLSELVFTADRSGLSDPPVLVLPNSFLQQMEEAQTAAGRNLTFRITGMVTEYRDRNYVMVDKFVIVD